MFIVPRPKQMVIEEGFLSFPKFLSYDVSSLDEDCKDYLNEMLEELHIQQNDEGAMLEFKVNDELLEEQYQILITCKGITLCFKTEKGCFLSLTTLKQILKQANQDNGLPLLTIIDEPDFKYRGLMLDISRNRVYKVETIKKIIDLLADVKVNQLQFNVEGKSFYYPSEKECYEDKNHYLTGEDIVQIDAYCKKKKIELVANQNSFGHMAYWLSLDKHKNLAECPEGFSYRWMKNSFSTTLNPQLKESFEFVKSLYDQYLPYYSSSLVNIGCDEPFELGLGKSKDIVEKYGRVQVYANFVNSLIDEVKKHGKHVMMWGDVLKESPDALNYFTKDIIALEWGYHRDNFKEEDVKRYAQKGFSFIVCPGTSMWNTLVGKYDNMYHNILKAARMGKKYNALGLLNTDWGDGGSWQQLSLSFLPYLIGASYAWNQSEEYEEDILMYANNSVYHCNIASFIKELGNGYHIEVKEESNATKLFKMAYMQHTDGLHHDVNYSDPLSIMYDDQYLSYEEYEKYHQFFEQKTKELDNMQLNNPLLKDELSFSLHLLNGSAMIGMYVTKRGDVPYEIYEQGTKLLQLSEEEFTKTWFIRNKKSDFELSIYRLRAFVLKCKINLV